MAMTVRPVETRKEWKAFFTFPWKVYGNDPWWVPPLFMDVKEMFDKKRNPFFEHAEIQPFLAYDAEDPVGRIVAIQNHAHNEFHRETAGFFGFFECLENPSAAKALFTSVEEWCRARGLTVLRGPTSFSTNDECGLLVEGFGSSPYIMMPYNPPFYETLVKGCGFQKAKDLYAFLLLYSKVPELPKRIERILDRVKKREHVVIRPIRMNRFREEVENVKEIYNSAWSRNWGFVPMTNREMDHMAKKLKLLMRPDIVLFAEVAGEAVGLALPLPNYNEVMKSFNGRLGPIKMIKLLLAKKRLKTARGLIVGVTQKYRKRGIAELLIAEWYKVGKRVGLDGGELSWVLEDNTAIINNIEAMGCERYKTYRIYERTL